VGDKSSMYYIGNMVGKWGLGFFAGCKISAASMGLPCHSKAHATLVRAFMNKSVGRVGPFFMKHGTTQC
jgi:hypothetical protein